MKYKKYAINSPIAHFVLFLRSGSSIGKEGIRMHGKFVQKSLRISPRLRKFGN